MRRVQENRPPVQQGTRYDRAVEVWRGECSNCGAVYEGESRGFKPDGARVEGNDYVVACATSAALPDGGRLECRKVIILKPVRTYTEQVDTREWVFSR